MLKRGTTLPELLVAITLLGVVGAMAAGALAQQGRVRTRVVSRVSGEIQLREALAPLVGDIATATAADVPAGGAQDSTFEVHATSAHGFVCAIDSSNPAAVHVAFRRRDAQIDPGDGAAAYRHGASGFGAWSSGTVDRVSPSDIAGCAAAVDARRVVLSGTGWASPPTLGSPVRFSRLIRYSLYRSSDGLTYLGLREFVGETGRFSTVQPIAGPFDRTLSKLTYRDAAGVLLPSGTSEPLRIATVTVSLTSALEDRQQVVLAIPLHGHP